MGTSGQASAQAGRRILTVDDDPSSRHLITVRLSHEGFQVEEAANGPRALELVAAAKADLVLLDMMMPGMDGIEVLTRIRQDLVMLDLPVIFVTARDDREARIRAKEAGASDFLTKPFDWTELIVRVRNLLDVKAYHDLRERHREVLMLELEGMSKALIHADRIAYLGTIAGGVGHELKNLATICCTLRDFMQARAASGSAPDLEDVAQLDHVASHLANHARHLMSLGRPGPDRGPVVDAREIVSTTVSMLERAGRLRGIRSGVELSDQPVPVDVSRVRVEQVLVNLLQNAADALRDSDGLAGRTVRAIVSRDLERRRAVFRVEDNGPGVRPSDAPHLFEPYFTTKPPDKGTGLGLFVSSKIVESYGGRIAIDRQDGWTLFSFDLPLAG